MDIRHRLYPYPVLSEYSDDYVDSTFTAVVDVIQDGRTIKLDFLAETDNYELNELLRAHKIEFVFHMECSQTAFRKVIRFTDNEYSFVIQDKYLSGRLQICSFIVAAEDLQGYVNKKFNDDYKGFKFDIEQGCIMAVGTQTNFEIEKDFADFIHTPSIFSIVMNADETVLGMVIDINQNKITVKLPEKDFYNYKALKQNPSLQPVLTSLVIIPSLIYVLEKLVSLETIDRMDYEDLRWYRSLKKTLIKLDFDIESEDFHAINTFETAQKLINYPVADSLGLLSEGYDEEDDE